MSNSVVKKVVVIGGGASGLSCALVASSSGCDVTIVEASDKLGRKLSQTGNGRCNITNSNASSSYYNVDKVVDVVLNNVKFDQVATMLSNVGVVFSVPDDEGRIYPMCYSSNSVVDALVNAVKRAKVEVICNCKVTQLLNQEGKVKVVSACGDIIADRVVVCVGSTAGDTSDSDSLIPKQYLTDLTPSLTPIFADVDKRLSGTRVKCRIGLLADNAIVKSEVGEVIFKDKGLGGIAVLNLSSLIARDMVKGIGRKYRLSLNLFDGWTIDELQQMLFQRLKYVDKACDKFFAGMLHGKVANVVCKQLNISTVESSDIYSIAQILTNWTFEVKGLYPSQYAQVVCGGIDSKYIDDKLAFTPMANVFVCGEALNVDGVCGGFNLHFAFASGMYVGKQL